MSDILLINEQLDSPQLGCKVSDLYFKFKLIFRKSQDFFKKNIIKTLNIKKNKITMRSTKCLFILVGTMPAVIRAAITTL